MKMSSAKLSSRRMTRLQKRLNRKRLEDLPNEMILKVMSYLEMKDLLRYSKILKCRLFHLIVITDWQFMVGLATMPF